LKFKHTELAVVGDIHPKILEQCNQINQIKDLTIEFDKKNIDKDFRNALETCILKQFWASKYERILGINL